MPVSSSKHLTTRQLNALKRHKKHHTIKHMNMMKREMKKGKSFTSAHNKAMRSVGK
tara:strand:+ start:356 stop:523 length:168 start_codon:yes stop_codon:yes gene_type:complete